MASLGVYAAALVLYFGIASGLQCYTCDSSKGTTCGYGLLSFTYPKIDCSEQSSSAIVNTITGLIPQECMKLVGVDVHGNEYIARGCTAGIGGGVVNTCDVMAKAISFADQQNLKSLDCYTCNSDLCNAAPRIGGVAVVVGLLIASLTFMF